METIDIYSRTYFAKLGQQKLGLMRSILTSRVRVDAVGEIDTNS